MSFAELKTAELREAAKAFAVEDEEVIEKSNAVTLRAALAEAGVTWEMYQGMFNPEVEEKATGVVTSEDVNPVVDDRDAIIAALQARLEELEAADAGYAEEPEAPVANKAPVLDAKSQYLVKMVRENPLFEIRGYRFTTEHPYALMSAVDAEVVLSEDGFRQATPSEVAEYYS